MVFFFKIYFYLFITYLFLAALGLSCGTRDLFVAVCGLLSSCGVQVFSSLVVVRSLQGVWAL